MNAVTVPYPHSQKHAMHNIDIIYHELLQKPACLLLKTNTVKILHNPT